MALANLRSILTVGAFRRLYATRLIGQAADGLLQAALATFVLFSPERQPTATSVAAAFAVLFLPYSFIGPFAGVLLDRWRRRPVLVYANLIRAVILIAIAALVLQKNDGISLAVVVLVVLGVGRFVLAGLSASLPHVVDGPMLVTANALTPTSGTIAATIGGLAGFGIRQLAGGGDTGSVVVLACAMIGYVLAALPMMGLAKNRLGPDTDAVGDTFRAVIRGFADGVIMLHRHPIAGRAVLAVMMQRIAFGGLTVIALLLTRNSLGASGDADTALGQFVFITAGAATGALLGAVITPGQTRRRGYVRWSVLILGQAAITVPLGTFAAAQTRELWPLIIAAFSLGFTSQGLKVCSDTLVQREIGDAFLGRVFALFDIAVNGSLVAGVAIVAFTAADSGVSLPVYLGVGVLLGVTAAAYRRYMVSA